MNSLRARQRARRQQAILVAAHALFLEGGFRSTSIEMIAERAEVAPGTVYNYFATKDSLLLAVAAHHFESRLQEHWREFTNSGQDPVAVVVDLVHGLIDWGLEVFDRALWRNVYAASLNHTSQEDEREFFAMDYLVTERIKGVLEALKMSRRIPGRANVAVLGDVIFAITNNQWVRFLNYDEVTENDVKEAAEEQLRCILTRELSFEKAQESDVAASRDSTA